MNGEIFGEAQREDAEVLAGACGGDAMLAGETEVMRDACVAGGASVPPQQIRLGVVDIGEDRVGFGQVDEAAEFRVADGQSVECSRRWRGARAAAPTRERAVAGDRPPVLER